MPVLVAGFATACGSPHRVAATRSVSTPAAKPTSHLRGLIPTPLPHKPAFTLTDSRGGRFSLATATRGKLVYLFFGYTHCPDVCPLTMADIAAALRRQPEAIRRQIEVVFVTVDPRRDTAPALRSWLKHYGSSFVGLTGSERQIRLAEQASGIPLAPPEKAKGGVYSVQHSSIVLAYSPDDRAHVAYADGFTAGDYAHDMPILLRYRTRT